MERVMRMGDSIGEEGVVIKIISRVIFSHYVGYERESLTINFHLH